MSGTVPARNPILGMLGIRIPAPQRRRELDAESLDIRSSGQVREDARRAQERGTEGFVIVAFTITESGTITDPYVIEGKCRSVTNRAGDFNDCTMFNSATLRAALKLKYKPTIRDGRAVEVADVKHRFKFELEDAGTGR